MVIVERRSALTGGAMSASPVLHDADNDAIVCK